MTLDKFARRNLLLAGAVAAPAIIGLAKKAEADTAFTGFAYPVTGGTANRTTPDRMADALNVVDFGADPSGANDSRPGIQACFDAAFGPAASPHSNTGGDSNKPVYIPNGKYNLNTGGLVLTQVHGGHIFSTGARGGCDITLNGTGSSSDFVVTTDGLEYSKFENINFGIASNQTVGTVFNMDRLTSGNPVNIQSNTFIDCDFGSGEVGMWINKTVAGASQGSENSFINCFFTGPTGSTTFSGLRITGQNALMNCVWGGDFQHHAIGIDVPSGGGSCPIIHGVSFQSNGSSTALDIQILTSSPDDYSIIGCRSESVNFAAFNAGTPSAVNIENCTQTNGVGGAFLFANGAATVSGCHIGGQFYGNMNLALDNCFFTSTTPWTGSSGTFTGIINRWHGTPPGAFGSVEVPQARWTFAALPPASMCVGMRLYIVDSSVAVTSNTNIGNAAAASSTAASFTGSISNGSGSAGTNLTVSSGTGIVIGQVLRGNNVLPGTVIVSGSGTAWQVFPAQNIASEAMTTGAANTVPIWSDGTNWRIG